MKTQAHCNGLESSSFIVLLGLNSFMYFGVRPDLNSSMTDPSRASVRVLRVIMSSIRGEGSALCSHVVKREMRQYFDHRGVGASPHLPLVTQM